MTLRILAGGPSNSGKSSFLLSLVEALESEGLARAKAIEYDVWSSSYPAFRGDVPFKGRPKRFGLDWDWKTPLMERIVAFNEYDGDIVFGDMPGILDEAIDFMCEHSEAGGAIVVSKSVRGLHKWREKFLLHGIPVVQDCVTFLGVRPFVLTDLERRIDADHEDVRSFMDRLAFLRSKSLSENR